MSNSTPARVSLSNHPRNSLSTPSPSRLAQRLFPVTPLKSNLTLADSVLKLGQPLFSDGTPFSAGAAFTDAQTKKHIQQLDLHSFQQEPDFLKDNATSSEFISWVRTILCALQDFPGFDSQMLSVNNDTLLESISDLDKSLYLSIARKVFRYLKKSVKLNSRALLCTADIESPDISGLWSELVAEFLQNDSAINSLKEEFSNLRQISNQKCKAFIRSVVSRATTIQHLTGVSEESRIVEKIFGSLLSINSHFIQLHLKSEDKLPTVKNILHAAEIVDKYPLLLPISSPADSVSAAFIAATPTSSENQSRRQWDNKDSPTNINYYRANNTSYSQVADRNRKYRDDKIRRRTRSVDSQRKRSRTRSPSISKTDRRLR